MNKEQLRMQMLAGVITESQYKQKLNEEESNWVKAKILTNVYYIGEEAEGDLRGDAGSAVPSYELPGYTLSQIKKEGDGMLYIKKGSIGYYNEEKGVFEDEDGSDTRIEKEYIKLL